MMCGLVLVLWFGLISSYLAILLVSCFTDDFTLYPGCQFIWPRTTTSAATVRHKLQSASTSVGCHAALLIAFIMLMNVCSAAVRSRFQILQSGMVELTKNVFRRRAHVSIYSKWAWIGSFYPLYWLDCFTVASLSKWVAATWKATQSHNFGSRIWSFVANNVRWFDTRRKLSSPHSLTIAYTCRVFASTFFLSQFLYLR